jgi:hypothetical protein
MAPPLLLSGSFSTHFLLTHFLSPQFQSSTRTGGTGTEKCSFLNGLL